MEVSFERVSKWSGNVDTVVKNILAAIARQKRQGIVGMSRDNLKMVTPTTGVTIDGGPAAYDRLFDQAIERAGGLRGFIIRG